MRSSLRTDNQQTKFFHSQFIHQPLIHHHVNILEGDRNNDNQVYLNRYQEVEKSQNQLPNQVPGSVKNLKPGTALGTGNHTRNFRP